ncbi:hypothetical protein SMACR_08677 [Sordaria macrospora]|uniref:V-type proton ATPase subunit G n=2 Tax=Sordaria macrospora TaxID=5147 RepID=F7WAM4_SORMK|nr:uncharacterized protein SMAC_08677 [Sordaria macrospora k-hell]KAA8629563.1 hypothetical protein SMACR_08677 [Sordaria macrospora]WPJ67300.1 hypothetical protein SMAC4_08677 [Sordaria macrospora]CCC14219.1 unnamed protein product [Sordaria macrospora k-hell]
MDGRTAVIRSDEGTAFENGMTETDGSTNSEAIAPLPLASITNLDLDLDTSTSSTQTAITMSAQNSAGIQTLLDAERDASKIVQKDRTKRVREARDEAKKEIEAYKAEKEAEFKKFEAEHTKGNKAAQDEADAEAETRIREIKEAGNKSREQVIKDLLHAVFTPVPEAMAAH